MANAVVGIDLQIKHESPADLGRADSMASQDSVENETFENAPPTYAERQETEHHQGTKTACCRINLAKTGFCCFMAVIILGPLIGGTGYYIEEQTSLTDPPPPTPSEQAIANPKCTYMTDSTCSTSDATIPQTVSEAYCPYYHNRKPMPQPQLPNCTMFRTSSCCMADEINQVFNGVQPFIYASERCQYYQRTLMCFICSPAQSIFYKNESLNVCTEYCDRYYDACKDAYQGINKIGELYTSGSHFCSELEYTVTNDDCYTQNSAAKSKLSFAALLLPLGLLALQLPKSSHMLLVGLVLCSLLSGASAAEGSISPRAADAVARRGASAEVAAPPWTDLSASIGNSCPLTGQIAAPQLLPNCSWYRQSACCTPSQVSAVFEDMELARLQFASGSAQWQEQCSNHLNFMMCHFCSPYQSNWISSTTGKVMISDLFCDETYMLCQDALTYWKYNCKEEHCDTEVYKRLQDEFGERAVGYSNGAEPTSAANKFCERQGFEVITSQSGTTCYDTGGFENGARGLQYGGSAVAEETCFKLDPTVYRRSQKQNDARGRFGMEYCDEDRKEFYSAGGCVGAAVPTRARGVLPAAILAGLSVGFTQNSARGAAVAFAAIAVLPYASASNVLLTSTVKEWAANLNTMTMDFVSKVLKGEELQASIDSHTFIETTTIGQTKFDHVKGLLAQFIETKTTALDRIVTKAEELVANTNTEIPTWYSDADKWNISFQYDPYFKGNTTRAYSNIKIPTETLRDMIEHSDVNTTVMREIKWTEGLDETFKYNMEQDSQIKWQYVGTTYGVMRNYPSVNLQRDLAGIVPDYDPRFRPWYIGATSGPKDVVIVMDCSRSTRGGGKSKHGGETSSEQIKTTVKRLLNTLSQQDHVSVICARGSDHQLYESYSCYGDSSCYKPVDSQHEELTCQPGTLVPATTTHLKSIMAKIDGAIMQGGSDFRASMASAFNLFKTGGGHGCNRVLIHVADGEAKDDLKYWCHHCRRRRSDNSFYRRNQPDELEQVPAAEKEFLRADGMPALPVRDLTTPSAAELEKMKTGKDARPSAGRRRAGTKKKKSPKKTNKSARRSFSFGFYRRDQYENMEFPWHTDYPRAVRSQDRYHGDNPYTMAEILAPLNAALGTNPASYWAYNTDEFGDGLLAACWNREANQAGGSYLRLNAGYEKQERIKTTSENMRPYLVYMEQLSRSSGMTWSSVYLDAYGIGLLFTVSKPIYKANAAGVLEHTGVAATDITVTDIEMIISNEMDHEIDSFLIDGFGKAVAHPSLKPASELLESPMLVDIKSMEMYLNTPAEFVTITGEMKNGTAGQVNVTDAPRFSFNGDFSDGVSWTTGHNSYYYYSGIPGSNYSFAFNLGDHDLTYKKISATRPTALTIIYHKVLEYPIYEPSVDLVVQVGEDPKYADNWAVAPVRCSVQFAARAFCNPESYLHNHTDPVTNPSLTVIHAALNSDSLTGVGCASSNTSWLHTNAMYDVWSAYPMQTIWLSRTAADVAEVPWTYFGSEHGMMLTLPGSRGPIGYDPTKRGWYRKAKADAKSSPHYSGGGAILTSVYQDAFGTGKLVSLSRAIYQKPPTTPADCTMTIEKPPGCPCAVDHDCKVGRCYTSSGNMVCSSETLQGVVSADIAYSDFNTKVQNTWNSVATQAGRRCGQSYIVATASGEEKNYETKCYVVDDSAHLSYAPSFETVTDGNYRDYQSVGLGRFEGGVMLDLVKKGFFIREQFVNYQGECPVEAVFTPEVHQWGLVKNAQQQDSYARTKGPFPRPTRNFQCQQNVVHFKSNNTILVANGGEMTGTVSNACGGGNYHLVRVESTNTYLLAIESWSHGALIREGGMVFNFGCHIANRTMDSGAWNIINGTCADEDPETFVETCPAKTVGIAVLPACENRGGAASIAPSVVASFIALLLAIKYI